jgi:23S rRNA (uracil1939-C5)-methyltransferase
MTVPINEKRTVTIEKLVQGGKGLARLDSQVLFVPGVLPGETVAVTGGVSRKGVQEAVVGDVLTASSDRVTPPCSVYGVCGGCQLQHIRYAAQLEQKRHILQETLARVGKVSVRDVPSVIASPHPYGYRSTVRFMVLRDGGGFALGFYEESTHRPVRAAECLLVPEAARKIILEVNSRLTALNRLPFKLETLEVRRSMAFGTIVLSLRTGPTTREQARRWTTLFSDLPAMVGQVIYAEQAEQQQRWVEGRDWIADRLDGLTFRISDRSFMQANWILNETLAQTIVEWVSPAPGLRVLELYSGIGSLGLPLARRGALVTEVESNPYALADARYAAKINHIGRCRFRRLSAETMLTTVGAGEYDLALLDPPRTGLSPACVHGLLQTHIPRLLYLSCDAATLARDLSRLCGEGYRIFRLQPFDMFPQTAHLETLVELLR